MGISFKVRDAQALFLDAQEPTTIKGFESNQPKFRGTFLIPPDHPAVAEFKKATVELLGKKAEKDFMMFQKRAPTPQERASTALSILENSESPAWGIMKARADGKYADQEGMFFFKCSTKKLALYVPRKNASGTVAYERINNLGSEEFFYPGGIYTVKVDVNLFQQSWTIFNYFNGLYWRARGNPRNFAAANEEEVPEGFDADGGVFEEAPRIETPAYEDDDIPF